MNILITAGGTSESIDTVRSISNHATGRLGAIIADTFAKAGSHITYVCSEHAMLPTCENVEQISIQNVEQLLKTLETLLHERSFDCVIHSMAVSDYRPQTVLTMEDIAEALMKLTQQSDFSQEDLLPDICTAILNAGKPLNDKKISSAASNMLLLLEKTPKVIRCIKAIQPHTLLVGFKLLSQVSRLELLDAGQQLLRQNDCDFVLANDLKNIKDDTHKAFLINKDGILQDAKTKQDIAEMIFKYVSERLEERK